MAGYQGSVLGVENELRWYQEQAEFVAGGMVVR